MIRLVERKGDITFLTSEPGLTLKCGILSAPFLPTARQPLRRINDLLRRNVAGKDLASGIDIIVADKEEQLDVRIDVKFLWNNPVISKPHLPPIISSSLVTSKA